MRAACPPRRPRRRSGCADGGDAAALDPGEWLPGGDTTNTLLLGSNAFLMPADNLEPRSTSRTSTAATASSTRPGSEAPASTEARDGLGPLFNARSCSGVPLQRRPRPPPLSRDEPFVGLLLRLSVPGDAPHARPSPTPSTAASSRPSATRGCRRGPPRRHHRGGDGHYDDGTPYTLLALPTPIETPLTARSARTCACPRASRRHHRLGAPRGDPRRDRLAELEDPDDADGDGISGRRNLVWDVELEQVVTGRFGWKAEQPTVRQQSAAAFQGDIGISSPMFAGDDCTPAQQSCLDAQTGGEPELTEALLDRVELYCQLLAVPARGAHADPEVLRGKRLFTEAGCDLCHTPSHRTSPDAALEELRDQRIWPYTDLLLHDMGEALSDHRPSFAAEGAEWRTPPLWGLRFNLTVSGHDRLLHDGRARGTAEAILWHGGEGEASRDAFRALSASDRQALIAFVESL
jgi:CxxC motif-containing protein (DUF1111 family)